MSSLPVGSGPALAVIGATRGAATVDAILAAVARRDRAQERRIRPLAERLPVDELLAAIEAALAV